MKQRLLIVFLSLVTFSASARKRCADIIVEAEHWDDLGGWCIDQQFTESMGSPYLLAHGMGLPVDDATTIVTLPSKGRWHVWVRTFNWTSPWAPEKKGPGAFLLQIDGHALSNELGTTGHAWEWQYAGDIHAKNRQLTVTLHDLTGFDGRIDAVCFTRSRHLPDVDLSSQHSPVTEAASDFVVVGGGIAGICAAVSASRLGLKTILVHDRPVLGGNNSSEVRVHLGGEIELPPYPNLGNLLKEFGHTTLGNANPASCYQDGKKDSIVASEPNITLLSSCKVFAADTTGGIITAIEALDVRSGRIYHITAPLFADCTGDGTLGTLAGADFSYGREGKDVYGEPSAPEFSDRQTLGASVQWYAGEKAGGFPTFDYGVTFSDASVQAVLKGEWTWETGMHEDMIVNAERVRDYALNVIYSNWSYLKNSPTWKERYAGYSLEWVGYVLGKRESRRLMGDYVLTQNDLHSGIWQDDASATTSWSIDLHYPDPANTQHFPGREFKAICEQDAVDYYPIPYRCFYSRNAGNLFMAGRDISVSHIALGTTRVMRTCGMMGEVVGMAASICHRHNDKPRDVYTQHLHELQALMKEGCGHKDLPNNQKFNTGHKARTNERRAEFAPAIPSAAETKPIDHPVQQ